MIRRRRAQHLIVLMVAVTSACTTTLAARAPTSTSSTSEVTAVAAETDPATDVASEAAATGDTVDARDAADTLSTTHPATPPEQDVSPTTSSAPGGGPTTTTTTAPLATPVPTTAAAPPCVEPVRADDTLESIATRRRSGSSLELWVENGFVERLSEGGLIDVCAGNGIDDTNGKPRRDASDAELASAVTTNVRLQQTKLNELFASSGMTDLDVDGVSGPLTGQRLCAARLALGLPTTIADMAPGSGEQDTLLRADQLRNPATAPADRDRWVLIDRTCQVMFVGSHADTIYIFPTSTGSEGFETRDQDGADVFRYNPAIDNGGWHNSSDYPVGVDNPLNGNLWKPLYFDLGQAIHGANYVPPKPDSKGCARLRIDDQTLLLDWLGLDDVVAETWRKPEIDLAVSVQGEFVRRGD